MTSKAATAAVIGALASAPPAATTGRAEVRAAASTTFTAFDDQGRPTEGRTGDGLTFFTVYYSDGSHLIGFSDDSLLLHAADGTPIWSSADD